MGPSDVSETDDPVVRALLDLAAGEPVKAIAVLAGEPAPLERALWAALMRQRAGSAMEVYVDPDAFRRFIESGRNPALYRATNRMLRSLRPAGSSAVVDIGCGDGRVTGEIVGPGDIVDLIEPSSALLGDAEQAVRSTGASLGRSWSDPVQEIVGGSVPGAVWAFATSTFALHNLDPATRREVLRALNERVGRLAIVEFDVPQMDDRSHAHAAYCAAAYRLGIRQHPDPVVIEGFLMPVLIGQFLPGAVRHTHEQPIASWEQDLLAAGYTGVRSELVYDEFWWAAAHVVTGEGGVSP